MISREQITSVSKIMNFNVAQVEKDYLQHLFLKFLYTISGKEFIFKGGTALQKCFGLPRFSEDLDFTYRGDKENIPQIIEKTSLKLTELYETSFKIINPWRKDLDSEKYKLTIRGPLYTNELSLVTLYVDISFREIILSEPDLKLINPIFEDIPTYSVSMMSKEELVSEKIRVIITRNKSRDVYDLWYLIGKKIPINRDFASKKLDLFNINYSDSLLVDKINEKKKGWNTELSVLIFNVPDFQQVFDEINSYLQQG